MAKRQQSTLFEHDQPTDLSNLRTGVLSGIGWSGKSPNLYFADQTNSLPIASLMNRRVRLSVSDSRLCTDCLEPTSDSICETCKGTPPSASCVWNPGISCTYQDCPYPDFKNKSCSHDFTVYLVAKDRVKVGIARSGGRVSRWKSQGATHALVFATAPNRKIAGIIETCCASVLPDRAPSNWFIPLDNPETDLIDAAGRLTEVVPDRLTSCIVRPNENQSLTQRRVVKLDYPQKNISDTSLAELDLLGENESATGRLVGVRGAVMAADTFTFNVQRHKGYTLTIDVETL